MLKALSAATHHFHFTEGEMDAVVAYGLGKHWINNYYLCLLISIGLLNPNQYDLN